jgi:hypothetical protein
MNSVRSTCQWRWGRRRVRLSGGVVHLAATHRRIGLCLRVKTTERLTSPSVAVVLHLVRSHHAARRLAWADHHRSPSFSPPVGHHRAGRLTLLLSRAGCRAVAGAWSGRTLSLPLSRVSHCHTTALSAGANRRASIFSLCRLTPHLIFRCAQVVGVPANSPTVVAVYPLPLVRPCYSPPR